MRHHDRDLVQSLTLVTAGGNPLQLADVKRNLRVETDDENDLIQSLMADALNWVDGRDGILGRALLTQKWQLNRSRFGAAPFYATPDWSYRDRGWDPLFWRNRQAIAIPLPPLKSIDSVKYIDTTGTLVTLDPSAWRVVDGGGFKSQLLPALNTAWPETAAELDAVQIAFTCGYDTADKLAAERQIVLRAMKLMIGMWYDNREAALMGPRANVVELPFGVKTALMRHKVSLL